MLFAPSLLEESSVTLLLVLTLLLAVVRISLFSIRDFFQLWQSGGQNGEVGIGPWVSVLCLLLATVAIADLVSRVLLVESLLLLIFFTEKRWVRARDRYPGLSGLLDSLLTVGCVYAVI
jgi:hypothetical protein